MCRRYPEIIHMRKPLIATSQERSIRSHSGKEKAVHLLSRIQQSLTILGGVNEIVEMMLLTLNLFPINKRCVNFSHLSKYTMYFIKAACEKYTYFSGFIFSESQAGGTQVIKWWS